MLKFFLLIQLVGSDSTYSSPALRQFVDDAALAAFGTRPDPDRPGEAVLLTRPTDSIRSSLAFSLDFFGGAIGIGMARPIDRPRPWKMFIGSAQRW
jgi:hypothetical protein